MQPARGAELLPDQPVIVAFDRPLDPDSVQVTFEPALDGRTTIDSAQVRFQPASFTPAQSYKMELSASANGYNTGPLRFEKAP